MVWEKNGTPNTLNLTGDLLSVDDLTAEKNSVLLCHALNSGTIDTNITFDDDTGSNYATRTSSDGAADATSVSRANFNTGGDAADSFHVYYTMNIADQEKLLVGNKVDLSATGTGTAPQRREQTGKWANTADQFTSVEFANAGAGSFVADSNLSVLSDVPTVPETIGGWVELGRTTLGSANATIDVTGLANKRYLMFLINDTRTAADTDGFLRLNSISTSTYAQRVSTNGAADSTAASATGMGYNVDTSADVNLTVGYLANLSAEEKLAQYWRVNQNSSGAGSAPNSREWVGKHAQTTNPITAVGINSGGSNTYSTGSEVVVLGWDPDDVHTGNFWEELASVELSSSNAVLSTGTFTAKKYLWFQVYLKMLTGLSDSGIQYNNDTGNNYARRTRTNSAGTSTVVNHDDIGLGWDFTNWKNSFLNGFIINNSASEKISLMHSVHQNDTGAAEIPLRTFKAGKWDNTSDQITEIDVNAVGANWDIGSIIKVWGSD